VDTVVRVVEDHRPPAGELGVEQVLAADAWARERARDVLSVTSEPGAGTATGTATRTAAGTAERG
jgi:1-deoxy-D-xylulose-5-phosphate reductoisomerase